MALHIVMRFVSDSRVYCCVGWQRYNRLTNHPDLLADECRLAPAQTV